MYHYNNNLYRSAFNLFDINGDGHIDFQEMNCLLRTLGQRPTEEEVRELCKVNDQVQNIVDAFAIILT